MRPKTDLDPALRQHGLIHSGLVDTLTSAQLNGTSVLNRAPYVWTSRHERPAGLRHGQRKRDTCPMTFARVAPCESSLPPPTLGRAQLGERT